MGPGHFGIAFAAKTIAPRIPLWALLAASEAIDLLCFGFAAMGIEKPGESQTSLEEGIRIITPGVIPWSHGLFMAVVWSAVAAIIGYLVLRNRLESILLGLVVFSHWVLDFIVHLPDLPLLFNDSPKLGLGLWGSGLGLFISGVLEILLLAGGMAIYLYWKRGQSRRTISPKGGAI
jgi:hypothetical protein